MIYVVIHQIIEITLDFDMIFDKQTVGILGGIIAAIVLIVIGLIIAACVYLKKKKNNNYKDLDVINIGIEGAERTETM